MTDPFSTGSAETGTAHPTTAAARDEAKGVAGQAASAGSAVVDTAKDEAANVAQEAKYQAKDLLHQTRSELTEQAAAQQTRAAQGLRAVHQELNSMAENSQNSGVASDLVRQAASRTGSMADWLDNRDPGSLLEEVKTFARRRPGAFLAIAAGAGLLAGRLTRSLAAGAPTEAAASADYQATSGSHLQAGAAYPAGTAHPAGAPYPAGESYPQGAGYPEAGAAVGTSYAGTSYPAPRTTVFPPARTESGDRP